MKFIGLLFTIIPSLVFAFSQATWEAYLRQEVLPASEYFDDLNHLKSWRTNSDFVINSPMRLIDQRRTTLRCQSNNLWPSHPYQSTKEYHAALFAEYDYFRLPPSSAACTIPNPTRRFCQRAATAKLVLTSDIYVDDCGHHYRAYWLSAYLSNHESMGTLFSKGRTAYERPGSSFRGDYVTGGSYGVKSDDFIYLTPLRENDQARLDQALKGIERFFTKKGKLFIAR